MLGLLSDSYDDLSDSYGFREPRISYEVEDNRGTQMGKCFHDNAPCFNSWSRQNRVATRNLSVCQTAAKSLLILLVRSL